MFSLYQNILTLYYSKYCTKSTHLVSYSTRFIPFSFQMFSLYGCQMPYLRMNQNMLNLYQI